MCSTVEGKFLFAVTRLLLAPKFLHPAVCSAALLTLLLRDSDGLAPRKHAKFHGRAMPDTSRHRFIGIRFS